MTDGGSSMLGDWTYNQVDKSGNAFDRSSITVDWVNANLSTAINDGYITMTDDGAGQRADANFQKGSEADFG